MKKLLVIVMLIVSINGQMFAETYRSYLNNEHAAEFINVCAGVNDTLVVYAPTSAISFLVWMTPESEQLWDQDSVIVTYLTQGNWYFSSMEIDKDVYIYFLSGPPSQPSCVHDSVFACNQPINWLVDAENLTPGYSCTYLWSNDATTQTSIFTTEGNHWVQITNDCGTITASFVISTNKPTITVEGNDTICAGETVVLTASGNASSYLWDTSHANPYAVAPTMTTYYKVVAIDDQGCTDTMEVNVVVNPVPITPVVTVVGHTLTSDALTGNQWYNEATGIIAGAQEQNYVVTQTGSYFCRVTDENGCSSDTSNLMPVVITGLEEVITNTCEIFPNPVIDELRIVIDVSFSVEIVSLMGEVLCSGYNTKNLNTSALSKGVYIIRVILDDGIRLQKIIIK